MTAPPRLRIEAAALIRGGRLLFRDFNLTLGEGEAATLTGPNGIGKSSLIRMAAGLLAPTAGRVERGGSAALADEAAALDTKLTLERALDFWARLDGGEAAAGMAAMGLEPLAGVPVRMLSTGQRKRAVLARVVASGAPLWLLDEPANGLDAAGLRLLEAAMSAHLAQGGAILAASHQPLRVPGGREVPLG